MTDIEVKYSICQRWLPSDKEWSDCEQSILLCKKEQFLLQILKAGQRRLFLLELKKKYAGRYIYRASYIASVCEEGPGARVLQTL